MGGSKTTGCKRFGGRVGYYISMRSIKDIPVLENIPVLVRAPLNVTIVGGKVASTFRLESALPTIRFLTERGARVILISHIGELGTETLHPVYEAMKRFIPNLVFCPETIGPVARKAARDLLPGGVLMLENLRRNVGEKKNDPKFAAELAQLADVFVEDSFDVCHREHAGVVGVPELLPSYAGFLVEAEVKELSKALKPSRPSLAIIGGAKFGTKEPVLQKLASLYDRVFVGGALANDFLQASGFAIGKSLTSGGDNTHIKKLLKDKKIFLPVDVVVQSPRGTRTVKVGEVKTDETIVDAGPASVALVGGYAKKAKTVLWNGPLGEYEDGFAEGTTALAREVAASKGRTVVGGGDTVAVIEKLGMNALFSFISTGGGAMLDFLAKGTLPGIRVLD